MELTFTGPMFEWRGPAPYFFVAVPPDEAEELQEAAALVSYGWGMVPVTARIGATEWTTSLWPREGSYVVPLKDAIRSAEGINDGDEVTIDVDARTLEVALSDEEIGRRVAAYEPPPPMYERGVLAKYAGSVGSASEGAITT